MSRGSVLVIGINYSPELTGIGKYSGETGDWLSQEGCRVQVVTAHPYYPEWRTREGSRPWLFRKESMNGVEVIRCPVYVPRNPNSLRRVFQDLSFLIGSFLAVTWLIARGRPFDVVMAVSPSMVSCFTAYWYRLWKPGCKFVVRIMDLQAEAAGELGMLRRSRMLRWIMDMEAWVLRKSDWVCPITPAMGESLVLRGVSRMRTKVFPLWVDFDRVGPADPDPLQMESLGIPDDKKVILYSGAIGEKQGLEVVVDMAVRFSEEIPELLFVVCGSGPYMEKLKKTAGERGAGNILFRGLQPEPVFNQLLNRAWLHLVIQRNTRTESYLPSKLMNIMAVGGLALVTAYPGTTLHSIVFDNEAGMLVSEPDAESMSAVVSRLWESPGEADRLRANARRYALENLSKHAVHGAWALETGLFGVKR
jgi:colanic acid biosynthesis glycosyl transferase WcaI